MRALCCLDIVKKTKNDTYIATRMGKHLTATEGNSYKALALMFGRESYGNLQGLPESIKTGSQSFDQIYGTGLFDYFMKNPDAAKYFDDAVNELSVITTPAVLAEYDFSPFNHVIDVGGGMGHLLFSILDRYPNLSGTVFDLPHLIERAVENDEFGSRCRFVAGKFFEGLPAGGDCLLLRRILHDYHDEDSVKILTNCRKAMNETGRLLVIETAVDEDDYDFGTLSMDLLMLVMLSGKERNRDEFQSIFERSGFRLNRMMKTRGMMKIVEAVPVAF